MSTLRKVSIPIAGLTLLLYLTVWWQARRELDAVRRELQAVTAANVFLKKTLGEMTITITAKDREIDRLTHGSRGCGIQSE